MRRHAVPALVALVGVVVLAACSPAPQPAALAPVAAAPANVGITVPAHLVQPLNKLSAETREAYLYAFERPDVLAYVPCYCGCNANGHTSNQECFLKREADGSIALESHGST